MSAGGWDGLVVSQTPSEFRSYARAGESVEAQVARYLDEMAREGPDDWADCNTAANRSALVRELRAALSVADGGAL